MAVTVRIMNWNIQNFGVTKCGLKFGNCDIVSAIAKIVVDLKIDIFVMLELNTTKETKARDIASCMLCALNDLSKSKTYAAMLSPNTGLEFYAFFVRDPTKTMYAPITGTVSKSETPTVLGSGGGAITDAIFTASQTSEIANEWAPLLSPDLSVVSWGGRDFGVPKWPGTRRPVVGLFYIPGASSVNRWLPIIACHFAAGGNGVTQTRQVDSLRYYSLLRGLGPKSTAPVKLQVRTSSASTASEYTSNYYVFCGDFNLDYSTAFQSYKALWGLSPPDLDTTLGKVNTNTHLVTPAAFSSREFKSTAALAISNYDNFFVRVNPASTAPVTATDASGVDVPLAVQQRQVTLKTSVDHYAELDQRGFRAGKYQEIQKDFASQIAGDKSHLITLPGALYGGRLISDHLPVILDLTIH